MRVRMLTTAAGPWGAIIGGHEGDVPDEVGRAMVAAHAAVEVEQKGETVEKVTPIETATAEPPENAMMPPARRRKKSGKKVSES